MAIKFVKEEDIAKQVINLVPLLEIIEDGEGVNLKVKTPDGDSWYVCRLDENGLALYSGFEDIKIGVRTSGDYIRTYKE